MCPERAPPWPPSCRDWLCRALWPRPFRPKLRPSAAPSIWRRCCSSVSPASIGGSAGRWRRRWRRCGADCTASIRPPPSTSAPRRGCSCSPMRSVRWQRWNSPPIRSLGSWRGGPPSPTQLLQILEEPLFLAPTPESITMREAEGAAPPPLLEEAELPEPTPEELQFISEAESELLPHLEEIPEEEEEVGGPAVGRPPPPAAPHSRPPSDPGSAVPRSAPPHSALRPHGWLPPELWDLWVRAARPIAPEPSEVEGGAGGSGATGRGGASRAPAELRPPEVVGAALPGLSGSVRCWLAAAGAVPPLRTNRHPARPTRPRPPLPQPRPRGMKGAWPRPALFYWTVLGVMAAASSNPCKGAGSGAGKGHRWGTGGCCGSVGQLWVSVGQLWVAMGLYRAVMGRYGSLWGS
ncbi:meiotic recombination protein REC8 homolog isoform X13 [Gallus gallus]|uniref:meiotic recombination protein REC8 homolog isoform X13 n=1 Tax=Gallus gallus TaxID=9031 RepID=UPI001AE27769|nr:meiotic recombination protein REC8 homolog isoform X13 [Gallus gallus]